MKEYKVMVKVHNQWIKATMQGWTQQTAFQSLEMAKEFQKKVKEYHARYNNAPYVGAKYKIMEREITEWHDMPQ